MSEERTEPNPIIRLPADEPPTPDTGKPRRRRIDFHSVRAVTWAELVHMFSRRQQRLVEDYVDQIAVQERAGGYTDGFAAGIAASNGFIPEAFVKALIEAGSPGLPTTLPGVPIGDLTVTVVFCEHGTSVTGVDASTAWLALKSSVADVDVRCRRHYAADNISPLMPREIAAAIWTDDQGRDVRVVNPTHAAAFHKARWRGPIGGGAASIVPAALLGRIFDLPVLGGATMGLAAIASAAAIAIPAAIAPHPVQRPTSAVTTHWPARIPQEAPETRTGPAPARPRPRMPALPSQPGTPSPPAPRPQPSDPGGDTPDPATPTPAAPTTPTTPTTTPPPSHNHPGIPLPVKGKKKGRRRCLRILALVTVCR